MKEVKFMKDGKEETCIIKYAGGYNDGYYWDMTARVLFEGNEYFIQNAGSGSGYVTHYFSVSLYGECKLTGAELSDIDFHNCSGDDIDYITSTISLAMATFFEKGCKLSYTEAGEWAWGCDIYIDGEKVEEKED